MDCEKFSLLRAEDITDYYTNGKLYDMISSGKFDDIYVGDYITTNNGGKNITWLIADLDNYLYSGDSTKELTRHHATIIPATYLATAQMNEENVTTGGYAGSDMVKTTLSSVLDTYIQPVFQEHIIKYGNMLTNSVNNELPNKYNTVKGASSDWGWYDRELDLMSEANVYGITVWSSSGYDTGIDSRQYAIFQLRPEFINSDGNNKFSYWLKDVAWSNGFAYVGGNSISNSGGASNFCGVRPRFLIG